MSRALLPDSVSYGKQNFIYLKTAKKLFTYPQRIIQFIFLLVIKEKINNVEIYIINSYTMKLKGNVETDFLLIDEVHHCLGADPVYFKTVLS